MYGMRKIFRELLSIEDARKKFLKFFEPRPLSVEEVPILDALNRVLAEDVRAPIDVPTFDRSIVDGYAVRAEDTYPASEVKPVKLRIIERVRTGEKPRKRIDKGLAIEVDTGAEIPAGANAVVPVEYTEEEDGWLLVYRRVSPGANIQYAGSDIGRGEILLRKGYLLTPRDIGVLAAIGYSKVRVYRKPKVGIISIGNELIPPGQELAPGKIYDVNTYTLATSVIENGGEPIIIGIARDDPEDIKAKLTSALHSCDMIITSGSSSAGYSDMLYRIINELGEPGVIVHGVKSKPGKPVILAVVKGKPVFGLPGFPTSSLIAFRTFVAPILRKIAGLPEYSGKELTVRITRRVIGEKGRRLFKTVSIHRLGDELIGYPISTVSGAITTLASAEGFFEIPENVDYLKENAIVSAKIFDDKTRLPDLVIIGPRSLIIEEIISKMVNETPGIRIKYIKANPVAAVNAVLAGEADIACVNLIDKESGSYNTHLLISKGLQLIEGFRRDVCIVLSKGNPYRVRDLRSAIEKKLRIANRERGSNYRELLDYFLMQMAKEKGIELNELIKRISGYFDEYRTENSSILAVQQGKADYCLAPREIAEMYPVDLILFAKEKVDFIMRKDNDNKLVISFLDKIRRIRDKNRLTTELR